MLHAPWSLLRQNGPPGGRAGFVRSLPFGGTIGGPRSAVLENLGLSMATLHEPVQIDVPSCVGGKRTMRA
jgi:hypothetical protein